MLAIGCIRDRAAPCVFRAPRACCRRHTTRRPAGRPQQAGRSARASPDSNGILTDSQSTRAPAATTGQSERLALRGARLCTWHGVARRIGPQQRAPAALRMPRRARRRPHLPSYLRRPRPAARPGTGSQRCRRRCLLEQRRQRAAAASGGSNTSELSPAQLVAEKSSSSGTDKAAQQRRQQQRRQQQRRQQQRRQRSPTRPQQGNARSDCAWRRRRRSASRSKLPGRGVADHLGRRRARPLSPIT